MFKIHWPLQNFTVWDDPKFCSAIGGKCDIKLEEVKFMQESGEPGSIPRSDINDIAPVKIQPLGSLYSFSTKILKKKNHILWHFVKSIINVVFCLLFWSVCFSYFCTPPGSMSHIWLFLLTVSCTTLNMWKPWEAVSGYLIRSFIPL